MISELHANQNKVNVEGEIIDISPVKEFSKFGKTGRVATATLKDDSGEVHLTLWDEQIDQVKEGDKIKISNGYVKEWQGNLQLNIGKYGEMEILS